MSSVPIELPLKPSEAAALADLIFQQTDGRPLTEEIRNRMHGRLGSLELTSMVPFIGSLQKDPVHSSAYYVAVDADSGPEPVSLLLRMALASSPASAHFPDSILIGRMRPGGGREIVVNAIPFAVTDRENIRTFAGRIDRSFYPRPQGAQSAISLVVRNPLQDVPAAFDAFRMISRKYGVNLASLTAPADTSAEDVYCTVLWAAIRAGWREGYNLGLTLPADTDASRLAVSRAPGYTRYSIPAPADQIFDYIHSVKSPQSSSKYFDFELSLTASPQPTTAAQLAAGLDLLKAGGRPAQLVAPKLSGVNEVASLADAARQFNTTLSFYPEDPTAEQALQQIGRATGGRFNVTVEPGPGTRPEIAERLVSVAAGLRG
ncbi:MAG: hypothetical protein ABJF23_21970 [Bryobacteraceae bacterium]